MFDEEIQVGDEVLTPGNQKVEVTLIEAGLYWLSNGLYAFRFELRKVKGGEMNVSSRN
jgi:hypothetical protein